MRWFILCLSLWLAAPVWAHAAELEDVLAKAMAEQDVPAMGAAIIRDEALAVVTARGVLRAGAPAPVGPQDRWHLGSNGKAMTATLIARLVEKGALSWRTPLAEMAPDLAGHMHPEYRDVTLLDLLSHRAGLGDPDDADPIYHTLHDDPRPLPQQRRDWAREWLAKPPAAPKRAAMHYSNTGYILAAHLAERATGKTYEQLMQDEVFGPLGMTSATVSFAGPDEPSGHLRGRPTRLTDSNPGVINPAGGWRMTLQDWARFGIDQLKGARGEGQLLTAESYEILQTPQGETRAALGWGRRPDVLGRAGPVLTHSGSDGTWFALVMLFPAAGDGLLVAANAAEDMGGDRAALAAIRAAAALVSSPAPR